MIARALKTSFKPVPAGGEIDVISEDSSIEGRIAICISSSSSSSSSPSHQGRTSGMPSSALSDSRASNALASADSGSLSAARNASRCCCGRRWKSLFESTSSEISPHLIYQTQRMRKAATKRTKIHACKGPHQLIFALLVLFQSLQRIFALRLRVLEPPEHVEHPFLLVEIGLRIRGDLVQHGTLVEWLRTLHMALRMSSGSTKTGR